MKKAKFRKGRKILALMLAIVMLATMLPLTVFAENSGDFEYRVLEDSTAEITKYIGSAKEVKIPSKIDGYTVTSIGWGVFSGCSSLTNVTIPNSVTYIGEDAFSDCTSLKNVEIGNGVTYIGKNAFNRCSSLTSTTIPDSVTEINRRAFSDCTSLKNVEIGNGVTYIGDSVFDGCLSLTSTTIPDSVTAIDWYAFNGCASLKSVEIGKGVTTIGGCAFAGCTSLKSVTIPENVTEIEDRAFGYTYEKPKILPILGIETYSGGDYPEYKIPGFTIYGVKGTAAEKYANDNDFKFIEITETIPGDVSGDGVVSVNDAIVIQRHIAGLETLGEAQLKNADLNGDGIVDEGDAIAILRIDAGLAS